MPPERAVLVFARATGYFPGRMDSSAADFGGAAWRYATKSGFSPAPTRYRPVVIRQFGAGCD